LSWRSCGSPGHQRTARERGAGTESRVRGHAAAAAPAAAAVAATDSSSYMSMPQQDVKQHMVVTGVYK
jgi:hypothetical protein